MIGIDEAGRGSIIGNLVIASIEANPKQVRELVRIGVKDSKQLSAKKRESLYLEYLQYYKHRLINFYPTEIDLSVKNHGLNNLEALGMADLIDSTLRWSNSKIRVYLDCPDVNTERFSSMVRDWISKIYSTKGSFSIISEHHADITYPIVSAASIIAKVERDRQIEVLKTHLSTYMNTSEMGSGYPSDEKTKRFLIQLAKTYHGELPFYVRHSWSSWKSWGIITEGERI